MAKYEVRAKVDQIVTKEIVLLVVARSEEEAAVKAHEALQTYPAPVKVEGVERIQTVNAHHWIPRDIDFREVREEKDIA